MVVDEVLSLHWVEWWVDMFIGPINDTDVVLSNDDEHWNVRVLLQ